MENDQQQTQTPHPKTAVQKNFDDHMIYSRKLQKSNKEGTSLKLAIPSRIVKSLELQKQEIVKVSIASKEEKKIIEVEPTGEIIQKMEVKPNNPITIPAETKISIIQIPTENKDTANTTT